MPNPVYVTLCASVRELQQISDHCISVIRIRYSGKAHAITRQESKRLRQPRIQCAWGPDETSSRQDLRVRIVRSAACSLSKNAKQVRSQHVCTTLLKCVTSPALHRQCFAAAHICRSVFILRKIILE